CMPRPPPLSFYTLSLHDALPISLILGLGHAPSIGLANLTAHGGFLPHGWMGVWLALTLAITSYMGIEVIAVTAGEAQQPETSIRSEEHTSELQSPDHLVCRLLLE